MKESERNDKMNDTETCLKLGHSHYSTQMVEQILSVKHQVAFQQQALDSVTPCISFHQRVYNSPTLYSFKLSYYNEYKSYLSSRM